MIESPCGAENSVGTTPTMVHHGHAGLRPSRTRCPSGFLSRKVPLGQVLRDHDHRQRAGAILRRSARGRRGAELQHVEVRRRRRDAPDGRADRRAAGTDLPSFVEVELRRPARGSALAIEARRDAGNRSAGSASSRSLVSMSTPSVGYFSCSSVRARNAGRAPCVNAYVALPISTTLLIMSPDTRSSAHDNVTAKPTRTRDINPVRRLVVPRALILQDVDRRRRVSTRKAGSSVERIAAVAGERRRRTAARSRQCGCRSRRADSCRRCPC